MTVWTVDPGGHRGWLFERLADLETLETTMSLGRRIDGVELWMTGGSDGGW